MRIFLTGFMGCGKSRACRSLARQMGYPFIDLDEWIEQRVGMTIAEYFSRQGEEAFREIESDTLRRFRPLRRFVMATGGGTPCFHDNMDFMNEAGLTVYLECPVDLLYERLQRDQGTRPLLRNMTGADLRRYIAEKLDERAPCYQRAQLVVSHDPAAMDTAGRIYSRLMQVIGH